MNKSLALFGVLSGMVFFTPLSFAKDKTLKCGLTAQCKECRNAKKKEWEQKVHSHGSRIIDEESIERIWNKISQAGWLNANELE